MPLFILRIQLPDARQSTWPAQRAPANGAREAVVLEAEWIARWRAGEVEDPVVRPQVRGARPAPPMARGFDATQERLRGPHPGHGQPGPAASRPNAAADRRTMAAP